MEKYTYRDENSKCLFSVVAYNLAKADMAFVEALGYSPNTPWIDFTAQTLDWVEDFPHENGNYQCICLLCKETFIGHKRRKVCKLCFDEKHLAEPDFDAINAWFEGQK